VNCSKPVRDRRFRPKIAGVRTWLEYKKTGRPRSLVLLVLVTAVLLLSLVEWPAAGLPPAGGRPPGYLTGQVLLENGQKAEGVELFFKVQKAFGASCYSRECDSFQKAVFRERLVIPADGRFEIVLPGQFLNEVTGPKAFVYTVVVRTPDGKFRPFYAFKISDRERVLNDFVLKPPFMETAPGGEDELDPASDI
jgi:hypothetical protein